MAFTHKYTLMCDDVRREDNGKLILIGMYTGTVGLPQLPFALPSLTFCTFLAADRPGHWPMKFRMLHLETGRKLMEGHGGIDVREPGLAIVPIKFGPVQFQAVGAYDFVLDVEECPGEIITGFNVALNIPTQIVQQPPR